jgi:hypothetical protein
MRLLDAEVTLHPHLLRTLREDYAWCVEHGLFDDDPHGRQSFVLGYAETEERIQRRTWRRARARDAALVRRAV